MSNHIPAVIGDSQVRPPKSEGFSRNNSINNLDSDGDGQVDYIKVTEYGDGVNKGFSFTVDTKDGQTQEIGKGD
jgi:hypothetical protein